VPLGTALVYNANVTTTWKSILSQVNVIVPAVVAAAVAAAAAACAATPTLCYWLLLCWLWHLPGQQQQQLQWLPRVLAWLVARPAALRVGY
jgi:hypothetical protein